MEDNKYFYEGEYRALSMRVKSLEKELREKREENKKQELLLEEMYKLIYYKNAWLTLSDENIRGMQKVVGRLPELTKRSDKLPWEDSDDDTWGI
jgi:hypothetical protein